ncbi:MULTISPECIES: molecular chaperone [unclassified Pseudomonas]|uniref:fimbrial biogenesis chaperone n=1 Tax=unclassified Pseudomonas TaxID=196821 RepID=UPI000F703FE1|nr:MULTISPECIES: fimbria/pilus periplasmic chaperone [unclassified Pseudomonas]AZF15611.1 Putative fimbrial chaperone [Pseudomonas sp. R3-18-08]AZF26256.1 Putative fimbrial chaperone [Pseudomonas sp. R2-60-08W]AZF31621.1 Putative fimbrial chaperone [Pseudomonas sp. R4-35-07]AZF36896.1 Putative fimbrial chaperone [Pseudomonas sp. R4-39-08]AZF52563.1 Putative fimbrial chaperone [Pseudomonas sp. R4-34-07]
MSPVSARHLPSLMAGLFLAACSMSSAVAGVMIDGTRVIYSAKEREVTVKLTNKGQSPGLLQVWIDRGDAQSRLQDADAPFLVTPPIFRLDPQKGQSVRIVFTGETLPQDRESLFWFNALEIPPIPQGASAGANMMQIAVRSRLKMFYRPVALSGDVRSSVSRMKWSVQRVDKGYVLRGDNPTPYHLSFGELSVKQGDKRYETGGGMIAPFSQQDFSLAGHTGSTGGQVLYRWIGDFGTTAEQSITLN